MVPSAIPWFLARLRQAALLREGEEQTDGQLLEAFVARQDAQALEVLVRRHAPMVWSVCRRSLANHYDAEDAFQATFLVLVRRASSIRSRELLANWLYGVARKTAGKARQRAGIRSGREQPMATTPEPPPVGSRDGAFGPEELRLLDEELSRLPEKYRAAIVLCDLEGRTRTEVARQFRVPEGTVGSRLARGREMLARRLTRRGLNVSATSVVATLPQQALSECLPVALLAKTIKVTTLFAADEVVAAGAISAQVATLTEAGMRATALPKLKAASAAFLIAALALSAGMVAHHFLDNRPIGNPVLRQDLARPDQAENPVLVVTAFYPGANAGVVADTVGGNLEEQIKGVEGLVRLESTSDNAGRYASRLYFQAETDPGSAMKLVKTRIWQAEPLLADVVVKEKITVIAGRAKGSPNEVAIAVIDRENGDRPGLQKAARVVAKRLEAEGALTKPRVFPGDDVKQLYTDVSHAKCDMLGVTLTEVFKSLEAAVPAYGVNTNTTFGVAAASAEGKSVKIEELKKVVVRDKVTLGDVADFKEVYGPAAVYRVDRCVAFRITGTPPKGMSVADAAAKCVELVEPEVKRIELRDFAVKNLSAK